ncbi:glycoside hydrolase family 3 protein [Clostridium phoceensis]|uniref:glycoside hydrolase family 3 protein n=1 Tax=Clostridium phoceensis TaxID=1650661 RepID=UPI00067ED6EF|nr:glycoside hydrolase family 3 N-terminal domain-containing protein [Clostridium phoceensis]
MRRGVLWALLLSFLLAGCAPAGAPAGEGSGQEPSQSAMAPAPEAGTSAQPQSAPEPEPPTQEELLQAMVDTMTPEEKAGQLFWVRFPETGWDELAREWHPGGFLLFGRDFKNRTPEELRTLLASLQETSPIPLLLGVDEEGGTVVRASYYPAFRAEKFRSPQALFAAGGLEAVRADALDKSAFLLDLGLNVNLAPVCDVSTDPADFIYARAFGQDAQATAEYADTVVSAMGEAGIGSVLKHFLGYGSNRDTHTGIAVDQRPLEQFRQSDFLPFQAGIDAGAGGVLVSHNIVTCLDPELPASLSPASYQVLREELGFEGVAMTDDLDMDAVQKYVEEGTAPVMALQAGADLVLTSDPQGGIPSVLEAVETGALTWDRLDQSVLRVLRWKLQLGLLSLPGAEDVQTS